MKKKSIIKIFNFITRRNFTENLAYTRHVSKLRKRKKETVCVRERETEKRKRKRKKTKRKRKRTIEAVRLDPKLHRYRVELRNDHPSTHKE